MLLRRSCRLNGAESVEALTALNNLAALLDDQGQLDEAEELYRLLGVYEASTYQTGAAGVCSWLSGVQAITIA